MLHPVSPSVWEHIPLSEQALREIVEDSWGEIAEVKALFTGERKEPFVAAEEETGTRSVTLVTPDEAPLVPLQVYLEQSDFDVRRVHPEQPLVPEEVESLVLLASGDESAPRIQEKLVAKYPALRSVPAVCVATPYDPETVAQQLSELAPANIPSE